MPFTVVCSCGAKLRAPENAAGKRVKCPKCASVLVVPAAEADFEELQDDTPAPSPAKKPTAARAKPAPVEVNEAVDDDEKPKKKRRRDDADEDTDDTPRKKKGKRRVGKNREEEEKKKLIRLIVGIVGTVVALGVVAGVIVVAMSIINNDPAKAGVPTQPTTAAPPKLPAGWSTFKGEGFSVSLPPGVTFGDKPVESVSLNPPATIVKQWSNNAQAQASGVGYEVDKIRLNRLFVEQFQKDPQAGWDELLKTVGDMPQGAGKPTVRPVAFAGETEGREVAGDMGGQGKMTVRLVVKGEYLYAVTIASKTPDAETTKSLFDSFKVE